MKKIRALTAKYFPERQLHLRTNGVVHFIFISARTQLIVASVVLAFFAWMTFTSYYFVNRIDILAAKDLLVENTNKNYLALNSQNETLKGDLLTKTKVLEERQTYLLQMLEKHLSSTEYTIETESATNKEKSDKAKDAKTSNSSVLSLDNETKAHLQQENKEYINVTRIRMEQIDNQQMKLADLLTSKIASRIDFIDKILKKTGIDTERFLSITADISPIYRAQGGEFILYSDNIEQDVNSQDKPFPKLSAYYNRFQHLEAAVQTMPSIKPVKKYYLSSAYGRRPDPINKKRWAFHKGIDMAGWWDTPIVATGDGTVTYSGRNGGYGNFISIDHGNGFKTRYGHIAKLKVKKGQKVTLGQEIALMGSTGRSTGPHLHYEVIFDGKTINPLNVFKATKDVFKIQQQKYDS